MNMKKVIKIKRRKMKETKRNFRGEKRENCNTRG